MCRVSPLLMCFAILAAGRANSSDAFAMAHLQTRGGGGGSVVPMLRRHTLTGILRPLWRRRQTKTSRHRAVVVNDPDNDSQKSPSSPSSSVTGATLSLIKAIIGTGCLALPAGLAVISDYPSTLVPANILLALLGIMSAYTFSLYGRLTHATQAKNLGELWKAINNNKGGGGDDKNDTSSSIGVVSIANFAYCFGCLLTYSLVIGDAVSSLLQAVALGGGSATPPWWASRQTAILAVTSTALWPLCNLSSLAALAPISLLGVLGSLLTTAFLAWRCPALFPSSPYAAEGEGFLASGAIKAPLFRTYRRSLLSPAPLILVAMGCVSLMAHFSACDFYHSFQQSNNENDNNSKSNITAQNKQIAIQKFNRMTIAGYTAVAVINALCLTFGFLTFGGNAAGIILNNYAAADMGAFVSRILVVISIVGGFPFLFKAAHSEAKSFFPNIGEKKLTLLLLSIVTGMSLVLEDAGFVVSLNGAIMGSAIIYIFPALLFLKQHRSSGKKKLERWLCRFLVCFGFVSAAIGGVTTVINTYFSHLLS